MDWLCSLLGCFLVSLNFLFGILHMSTVWSFWLYFGYMVLGNCFPFYDMSDIWSFRQYGQFLLVPTWTIYRADCTVHMIGFPTYLGHLLRLARCLVVAGHLFVVLGNSQLLVTQLLQWLPSAFLMKPSLTAPDLDFTAAQNQLNKNLVFNWKPIDHIPLTHPPACRPRI